MKLNWIVWLGVPVVLMVATAFFPADRGANSVGSTPFMALSRVPVPEMPAIAAELVHAAAAAERERTTQEVLRTVSTISRFGTLPYVVSAICHRNPEVAGTAVETALEFHQGDVLVICKAAFCAAPGQVQAVVTAACLADPPSFANVAMVAFQQMPSANNLILAGLVGAIPGLEFYLEKAEVQVDPNDFEAVIRQTAQLVTDAGRAQTK